MLQLKNVIKTYTTGDITQNALNDVSVCFRENEFVSVLGQSGSGKTTMLNVIGGLDRYTSGDLIINGVSTKEYTDADWDYYRNNSIGFVFQSYNLIPHQTVLANVEMALTLAGVSPSERKQRATTILKKVGLGDHLHKKPNQMSGGQMQRVAIARALVNNPDILLADEPTGALDSETSVQIMELLKEIAKDKLVIMVTHNPELAERYSTRIVKLKDGKIVDDSNPFTVPEKKVAEKPKKKTSMSFLTTLSLSFDNLRTKKGRTLLTAFAGSIGIIGIALILALSTGMNAYIKSVQKDTMTSYPITISSETIDVSSMLGVRGEIIGSLKNDDNTRKDGLYADYRDIQNSQSIASSIVKNNLTEFKKYLDDENSEIHKYLGENGIVYAYDVSFDVYSFDSDGEFVNGNVQTDGSTGITGNIGIANKLNGISGSQTSGSSDFSELMVGSNGETVSRVITDSYDLLYGSWPTSFNEVVLVADDDNGIDAATLYRLGFITKDQYDAAVTKIKNGETADEIEFSYATACAHELYLIPAYARYEKQADGTFSYIKDDVFNREKLLNNAIKLKICAVIRPKMDAANANISTAIGYTAALTDRIINESNESAVIKAQEATPEINVLTGMKFSAPDDAAKAEDAKTYLSSLGVSEKASFYKLLAYYSGTTGGPTDEQSMAAALDTWLATNPDQAVLVKIYDEYLAGSSYEENLQAFGKVSYDAPYSISIYTDTFENKEAIAECIAAYNQTAPENARITYVDYVAILTSSLTTIIDGISYVLVAFVSISLIVSCIMIGIITHISVMERTKEIGILRALGASKRNVSQVFNAETFIIGCCAGLLGIGISLLALIPINSIIVSLTGIAQLNATLPITSSLLLIALSIVITIIGGLIPSKKAAKKDPVIALRTE